MLGHTVGCHVLPKVGMYVPILAGVANLPAWFHVLNQGGVKMIGVKALNSMGYISHLLMAYICQVSFGVCTDVHLF